MSGPNDNYDPKQVAALSAEALEQMVTAALAAFAAASSTAALKDARLAHTGEKSPIALANREIGALPPAARGAGTLVSGLPMCAFHDSSTPSTAAGTLRKRS